MVTSSAFVLSLTLENEYVAMLEAIEGARYYDSVYGRECVISSVVEDDDMESGVAVELNYDGVEGTITVDLNVFRESDGFEVQSIPDSKDNWE